MSPNPFNDHMSDRRLRPLAGHVPEELEWRSLVVPIWRQDSRVGRLFFPPTILSEMLARLLRYGYFNGKPKTETLERPDGGRTIDS